jgi:methionyl-tRNA synthetase
MPESKDTDWDWDDFVSRNNNELVATWGNLANRVLSFAYKHWDGVVPNPGELRAADNEILKIVAGGFATAGEQIDQVHLRNGLFEAIRLASEVNKYIDKAAPWFEIKTDKEAAGKSIYTALKAIDSLKIILAPFLPFTSERLHSYLGYDDPIFGQQTTEEINDELGTHDVLRYLPEKAHGRWVASELEPGRKLRKPEPLFQKLDRSTAEAERARLG